MLFKNKLISFFKNKRNLVLIAGLVLFSSLIPSQYIQASTPWDSCGLFDIGCYLGSGFSWLISLPMRIMLLMPVILIWLGSLISSLIYSLIVIVCNWLISIFLQVGITPSNPITPQIVTVGWTFTRDFVNMFFILILVFIGLATILRLRDYEAKKLLPKLIITALLINFTPVIVGFIVDMGNIVTYFFFRAAAEITNLPTVLNLSWNYFSQAVDTIIMSDALDPAGLLSNFAGILIYGIVLTVFFLWGSWIYFWIMLSLFFRITELWVLMIICPIAFFSNIFPSSDTVTMLFPDILHWKKWWQEFLKWIIWAIPIGFFLYLSNWIMVNTSVVQSAFNSASLGNSLGSMFDGYFINLIRDILAPVLALILLNKGYKIAEKTAPAAAKGILDGIEKLGKTALAAGITVATAGAGAGAAAGLLGKAGAAAGRLETYAGGLKGGRAIYGKPLQAMAKISGWGTRRAAEPFAKYSAKATKMKQEKVKTATIEELERAVISGTETGGIIERGAFNPLLGKKDSAMELIRRGKWNDLMKKQPADKRKKMEDMEIEIYKAIYKDKKNNADASAIALTSPTIMDEAIKIKFPKQAAEIDKMKVESERLKIESESLRSEAKLLKDKSAKDLNEGERAVDIGSQTTEYGKKLIRDGKRQIKTSEEILMRDDIALKDRKKMNELIAEGKEMIKDGEKFMKDGEKMKADGGLQVHGSSTMFDQSENNLDLAKTSEGLAKQRKEESKSLYQQLFNAAAKDLPDDKIKNLDKDLFLDPKYTYPAEWIISEKSNRLSEVANTFGKEAIDAMQKTIESKDLFNLAKSNPNLVTFLNTNAAHGLGLGLPSQCKYKYKDQDVTRDFTSRGEFNKFINDAREAAKQDVKINVLDVERKDRVPQTNQSMPEEILKKISSAEQVQSVIDQQRDILHVLAKNQERTSVDRDNLEKISTKTEEQAKFLKKMKEEIIPKQKEDLSKTLNILDQLEKKQKVNLDDIKEQIKITGKEIREEIDAERLEDQSKRIKNI